MPKVTTTYCTDEAILIRCPSDYHLIARTDQKRAGGSDGAFSSGDRWKLTSASNDFLGQSVQPGHIAHLREPARASSYLGTDGDCFVVESVEADGVTLRRPGAEPGEGLPPSPPSGATSIRFDIYTLEPQIEAESYRINKLYGIDEKVSGATPSDLYDIREIEELCVWRVLKWRYFDSYRSTSDTIWKEKGVEANAEISELSSMISLHWGPSGTDRPPTTSFGTRLSR